MKNFRGWSLLETLICILITAGFAWGAIPRANNIQLRTDAKFLAEYLRGVRHRAIVEHKDYTLSYQSGVCSVFPNQSGLIGLCRYLKTKTPSQITFHTNGVCTPKAITLVKDDLICTISISLRGRVRLSCAEFGER